MPNKENKTPGQEAMRLSKRKLSPDEEQLRDSILLDYANLYDRLERLREQNDTEDITRAQHALRDSARRFEHHMTF